MLALSILETSSIGTRLVTHRDALTNSQTVSIIIIFIIIFIIIIIIIIIIIFTGT